MSVWWVYHSDFLWLSPSVFTRVGLSLSVSVSFYLSLSLKNTPRATNHSGTNCTIFYPVLFCRLSYCTLLLNMPKHLPCLLITITYNSLIYFLAIPEDYDYISPIISIFWMSIFHGVLISYYLGLCCPQRELKLWDLILPFSEIHGFH